MCCVYGRGTTQASRAWSRLSALICYFDKGHWQLKFLLSNLKVLTNSRINVVLIPCQSVLLFVP